MAFASPFPPFPTRTPLDGCLGGAPSRHSVILVRGPSGAGKTTLLLALAEGISENTDHRVLTFGAPSDLGQTRPRSKSPVMPAYSIEHIGRTLRKHPFEVVLVDNAAGYPSESQAPGASANAWMKLLCRARQEHMLVVLTGRIRESVRATPYGTPLGNGCAHVIDTIMDLIPLARTSTHPGMVVETRLTKHRGADPSAVTNGRLWLRPGHTPPMTST